MTYRSPSEKPPQDRDLYSRDPDQRPSSESPNLAYPPTPPPVEHQVGFTEAGVQAEAAQVEAGQELGRELGTGFNGFEAANTHATSRDFPFEAPLANAVRAVSTARRKAQPTAPLQPAFRAGEDTTEELPQHPVDPAPGSAPTQALSPATAGGEATELLPVVDTGTHVTAQLPLPPPSQQG